MPSRGIDKMSSMGGLSTILGRGRVSASYAERHEDEREGGAREKAATEEKRRIKAANSARGRAG
jgi:hypothetical protein